jgi:DNA replication protein
MSLDLRLMTKLIDDGVVDVGRLVLANYKAIGLNETAAFIVIELIGRSRRGEKLLNPDRIAKDLSLPSDQVAGVLEELIHLDLLRIEMVPGANGRETEAYNLNNVIARILADYDRKLREEDAAPRTYATPEEEIVDMLETGFQKQLTPIEIEIIKKWTGEEHYQLLDIRRAVLDAVKANRHTLSYVDSLLAKRRSRQEKTDGSVKYDASASEALKTFFDSWPKK